ncbi:MAG TPA: hypothetical protein VIJ96_09590 [Acidothermaceae bacterium]
MNGRESRRRHQGDRQRVEALLKDVSRTPAEFVEAVGAHEVWRRGNVAFVVPRLDDDLPARLKSAVSRRRRATLDGICDCGGRRHVVSATHVEFAHDPACDATDDNLVAISNEVGVPFRRWIA